MCDRNYSTLGNYNNMPPGFIQLPSPQVSVIPTFGLSGNYNLYNGTCPTGNSYFTVCAAYPNTCGSGRGKCAGPSMPLGANCASQGMKTCPSTGPSICYNMDDKCPKM
jgi:hypothetical protein